MKTSLVTFLGRGEALLGTICPELMVESSPRPSPSRYSRLAMPAWGGLAATPLPAASRADIYKTVDAAGVISFTNTPRAKSSQLYQKSDPAKPSVFMPSDTSPERFARYDGWIREASALYQIPEALVRAVIRVESDFDP